tara:strand:- start:58 stop:441 length:384 start_codon:yes stop_codon:yes gene_type:complete
MRFSKDNQPANSGRKKLPRDLAVATSLTKAKLEGLLNLHLWMTEKELEKVVKDAKTPMISKAIASIISKAIENGDDRRLTFILDRLIGKPKEEIDITAYMVGLKKMTTVDVIDMGAEAMKFLKEKGE